MTVQNNPRARNALQPSLRDERIFLESIPSSELLGYFRLSLRDKFDVRAGPKSGEHSGFSPARFEMRQPLGRLQYLLDFSHQGIKTLGIVDRHFGHHLAI